MSLALTFIRRQPDQMEVPMRSMRSLKRALLLGSTLSAFALLGGCATLEQFASQARQLGSAMVGPPAARGGEQAALARRPAPRAAPASSPDTAVAEEADTPAEDAPPP